MALNGIDVSKWQAGIEPKNIPGDFVIIKATEGVGYTDPQCDVIYQKAKKAGKLLGVYHFARPDGNKAIDEASWFVSQVKGYINEAILILDLEVNPITPSWAKAWLDKVYELTNVRPLIYMSASKFNSTGDWSAVNKNYGAWVAGYPTNNRIDGYNPPANPYSIPDGWTYAMWQYTSNGFLSGYSSRLDLDIFYGSKEAWKAYSGVKKADPVITTKTETKTETIPYKVEKKDDSKLEKPLEIVEVHGVNGTRTIIYSVTYTNGKETARTVKSDTTVQPIDEIIVVGTKEKPIETTPNPSQPEPEKPTEVENPFMVFLEWLIKLIKDIWNKEK